MCDARNVAIKYHSLSQKKFSSHRLTWKEFCSLLGQVPLYYTQFHPHLWDSKKNLHTDISIYFHFISSSYKFQIVLTKQFQMKYLIIIISVFINTGKIIAQSPKLDTIVSLKWFGSAWQNNSRTINNYDADCRLKTALTQNWDITGKWVDYSIKRYSYISGNYISEILTQLWLNNAWTDNYKQIYTYDVSLKILSIVDQSWYIDHWSNYNQSAINMIAMVMLIL